jgi:hypothetical protein
MKKVRDAQVTLRTIEDLPRTDGKGIPDFLLRGERVLELAVEEGSDTFCGGKHCREGPASGAHTAPGILESVVATAHNSSLSSLICRG